MGWLSDWTDWIETKADEYWTATTERVREYFEAVQEWAYDMGVDALDFTLDVFASIVESIPIPGFMETSLGSLLGNAGPQIAWAVGVFRIGDCFAILAAGYVFRLLRKLLTAGQW